MIKIGITGSTGVLGKSLIYHLKKISRYKTYNYKHNILNKKKIEHWIKKNQFQIIIHLAALVPTKKVSKNFKLANDVNIKGTKNLVNSIKKFQNQQMQLLEQGWSHLKKNGKLLYITCSIFNDENEDVIRLFLKKHTDVTLEKIHILKDFSFIDSQLIPNSNHDGLFFQLLTKN